MRFQRIIEALYRQPLDITAAGFEAVDAIVRPHLIGKNPTAIRDGQFVPGKTDIFGEPLPEMLEFDEETGLAMIHISGPLIQHASLIEKSCGACSYEDIEDCLEKAMRSQAHNILMLFDSPGGEHCGCPELAEKIADLAAQDDKGIYAYTETQMCSAAYYLAAGANAIYCTGSSYVGCIGSMLAWVDFSKAYEMAGMKPVVFASGKYKAAGLEGTSLSEEQAAMFADLVNKSAGAFKEHVLANRNLDSEMMEGQTVHGFDAAAADLVDELVPDLDELVEELGS